MLYTVEMVWFDSARIVFGEEATRSIAEFSTLTAEEFASTLIQNLNERLSDKFARRQWDENENILRIDIVPTKLHTTESFSRFIERVRKIIRETMCSINYI